MSKGHRICNAGWTLSATTLEWCRRTAHRYWRGMRGIARSVSNRFRNTQFKGARPTVVSDRLQLNLGGEQIALKEVINILNIGDRIRVLCDDGVLLAEKISETQFELIHAQATSKYVH